MARVLPRDWDAGRLLRFLAGLAMLAVAFLAPALPAAPADPPAAIAAVEAPVRLSETAPAPMDVRGEAAPAGVLIRPATGGDSRGPLLPVAVVLLLAGLSARVRGERAPPPARLLPA